MTKVYFSDTDDIVNLWDDEVFKAAFTQNTPESREAMRRLLAAILKRELTVLTITANEPPIHDLRDRQIRYDIGVNFNDGELANVEITLWPGAHEALRLEYYVGRLFLNQDIKGKDRSYKDLKRVYQISLIANRRMFDDGELVHHFAYHDQEHAMPLGGRTTIITLELEKLGEALKKPVAEMDAEERWSIFVRFCADKSKRNLINELLAQEEGIALVGQTMKGFTKEQLEYFRETSKLKWELDRQSHETELRDEGRELGRAESRQIIAEQSKALEENARVIAELRRQLEEKAEPRT
jgi:predicted transposase/invertase (TIGR01784 family)